MGGAGLSRSGLKIIRGRVEPKKRVCKAQCAGHSGAMFKRCNAADGLFWAQPKGPTSVFAHFVVARRSLTPGQLHSSRLELREIRHRRDPE